MLKRTTLSILILMMVAGGLWSARRKTLHRRDHPSCRRVPQPTVSTSQSWSSKTARRSTHGNTR